MKVINEFEHEGKTMQVFEDLSVKEKPTKLETGKHLLKDVIRLLKQGDKFTVEFTVDTVQEAMVCAIGEGCGGSNAIYDDAIIQIGETASKTESAKDLLTVDDLTDDDIGDEFQVVSGYDRHDKLAAGHTFELDSLDMDCFNSRVNVRFTDGFNGLDELHANTIIRRIS